GPGRAGPAGVVGLETVGRGPYEGVLLRGQGEAAGIRGGLVRGRGHDEGDRGEAGRGATVAAEGELEEGRGRGADRQARAGLRNRVGDLNARGARGEGRQ